MYFEGDPWIAQDEEIKKAPAAERDLLIAKRGRDESTGLTVYTFDIVLDKRDA